MANRSIFRQLVSTLTLVSALCAMMLIALLVSDYHLTWQVLSDPAARGFVWIEFLHHVFLPLVFFLIPTLFAIFGTVRLILLPLRRAAERIGDWQGAERGFRLTLDKFPAEILPFAEAINALLARIDTAAQRHEAFAADVAHELRTPLSVLLLEVDAMDELAGERLRTEIQHMQRLIDQLLLLAQIDAASESILPRTRVDLNDVAQQVICQLAPGAIADGRRLELDEPEAGAVVEGWGEAISAALRNITENALRVTPRGTAVVLSVGPGPQISVTDGGPGISAERLLALSKRNARGSNASDHGAGLGLAIVERIAAAHGGSLTTQEDQRKLVLRFAPAEQST